MKYYTTLLFKENKMIEQGQKLAPAVLSQLTPDGMKNHQVTELFAGKKVVLFAVPGAFTPTCSESHLPGYVVLADQFKAKGVDLIACVSVNDAFVMKAWGEAQNASELMMLADGDASFAKSLGLEMDTDNFGGVRSQRYAMIIDDGVVTQLNVEAPKEFSVSTAEVLLEAL
jgi:peroxiredoxin